MNFDHSGRMSHGIISSINSCMETGADLGFSRGGGADFQKKFENFDDLFFYRSTKLIF